VVPLRQPQRQRRQAVQAYQHLVVPQQQAYQHLVVPQRQRRQVVQAYQHLVVPQQQAQRQRRQVVNLR
jgi:hypothetical protein